MAEKASKTLVVIALSGLFGALVTFGYVKFANTAIWFKKPAMVRTEASDEIMVMRTPGGLLEVSRIRAKESFDTEFVYTVLGFRLGKTVPRIRVPVVYRYHVELAPEWRILRTNEVFTVVAPAVKPNIPVAVDLGLIEKEISGTWALIVFNEKEDLEYLEKSITSSLSEKAVMPAYIQLQREAARQTVTEFVHKWLLTQSQWRSVKKPRLKVLFADEPVGSIDTFLSPREKAVPVKESQE